MRVATVPAGQGVQAGEVVALWDGWIVPLGQGVHEPAAGPKVPGPQMEAGVQV